MKFSFLRNLIKGFQNNKEVISMFRRKRKTNPLIFTISAIGVGALAYYVTKEAMEKEESTNGDMMKEALLAELGNIDL